MLSKFSQITTFVFDVDGVLTDSTILVLPDGVMARAMNIKDGFAMQLAVKRGYRVLIITGGTAKEVEERFRKLGIQHIWMGITDKAAILGPFMQEHGLQKEEVLYMGDDLPDLPPMRLAGLPCCPADAVQEVKELSEYQSHQKGGEGCVRDVIEKVMRLRGNWGEDVAVRAQ